MASPAVCFKTEFFLSGLAMVGRTRLCLGYVGRFSVVRPPLSQVIPKGVGAAEPPKEKKEGKSNQLFLKNCPNLNLYKPSKKSVPA